MSVLASGRNLLGFVLTVWCKLEWTKFMFISNKWRIWNLIPRGYEYVGVRSISAFLVYYVLQSRELHQKNNKIPVHLYIISYVFQ